MMKTYASIVLTVLVVFQLSCTESGEWRTDHNAVKTFHARVSTFPDTKVYTDGVNKLYWNADDRISIFRSSTNEEFRYKGSTGADVGTFEKVAGQEPSTPYARCYSIYPYNANTTSNGDGVFTIQFPSVQHYKENSFGVGDLSMAAITRSVDDEELCFSNLCGCLVVKIYGGFKVSSITLKGNNNERIAGDAQLSFNADDEPMIEMSESSSTQITLYCGEDGISTPKSSSEYECFWITLPPVTFSNGFTLEITGPTGTKMTKKTNKSINIRSNHVKPMASCLFAPAIDKINGSDILYGHNLAGLISDSSTGAGIAGVPVTDGYSYCVTDENGVYQMKANKLCRFVYYSRPSGYETNLDSANLPTFYSSTVDMDPSVVNRYDFELTPNANDETDWTLLTFADIQTRNQSDIQKFISETLADLDETLKTDTDGRYKNPYATTLGDHVQNVPSLYPTLKQIMGNIKSPNGNTIPFYQCIGNHDHTNGSSQYEAMTAFVNSFGPVDYSYNIGNVHIVVMNDIIFPNWSAPIGGTLMYGISDTQYNWLLEDLKHVDGKEGKMIIFCVHAPLQESTKYVIPKYHYYDILNQLSKFYNAHIFAGHTHRFINYVHNNYICRSGMPVYNHTHTCVGGGGRMGIPHWRRRMSKGLQYIFNS